MEKEANMLSQLSDYPYVVKYREAFTRGSVLCLVMEFCTKGDLQQQITTKRQENEIIPEVNVIKYFTQIAMAVAHLHHKGILHRDLKLSNVLVDSHSNMRLSDFGLSKDLTQSLATTQLGTIPFMSPEIFNGAGYSFPADMWALGCILYELLSLRQPFNGKDQMTLLHEIRCLQPAALPPRLSGAVVTLCMSLLDKDPSKRPTIDQLLVALNHTS
eukprot:GHVQ01042538.1.p1 GENE.GHVQ01042538.1~~GHVQ01042538.1.p1  ORF type:complete len:215 (+),score=34.44 GHVQ01042538.1:402-1046(+)